MEPVGGAKQTPDPDDQAHRSNLPLVHPARHECESELHSKMRCPKMAERHRCGLRSKTTKMLHSEMLDLRRDAVSAPALHGCSAPHVMIVNVTCQCAVSSSCRRGPRALLRAQLVISPISNTLTERTLENPAAVVMTN